MRGGGGGGWLGALVARRGSGLTAIAPTAPPVPPDACMHIHRRRKYVHWREHILGARRDNKVLRGGTAWCERGRRWAHGEGGYAVGAAPVKAERGGSGGEAGAARPGGVRVVRRRRRGGVRQSLSPALSIPSASLMQAAPPYPCTAAPAFTPRPRSSPRGWRLFYCFSPRRV